AAAAASLVEATRAQLGDAEPRLLVAFASPELPLRELAPRLHAAFPEALLLSASTAGEFTEAGDAKGSVALFALAGDYRVMAGMAAGLAADVEGAVQRAVAELPASVPGYPCRTAILLLDPLAGSSEEATLLVSTYLGHDARLAGGAAGDDLAMKATVV